MVNSMENMHSDVKVLRVKTQMKQNLRCKFLMADEENQEWRQINKGGKFLKKLWCCLGGGGRDYKII